MKSLFLTSALLLLWQLSLSQSFWAKTQAGGNVDETLDLVSDAAGNSYATGYFSSVATINGSSESVQGLTDVFVTKVSSSGNTTWVKSFGGSQSDRGLGLAVDGSGNVLVCGFYTGSISFGDGVSLTSNGGQDAFIVKFNSGGTALWAKTGGSSGGSDRANAVAVDGSGNVVITGQFSGEADFGALTLNAADGTNDAFIVKYDSNGGEQWAKQGTGESLDRGLAIATDNSGSVYATGQFSGEVTFDNTYTNTIQNAVFIVKYTASGSEDWFRWGGGSEESIAYDIVSDGSSVYLTGDFGSTINFFGTGATESINSPFSSSVFLAAYSGSGGFSWGTSAGSNSNVSSRGIDVSSGNLAIAGFFECTFESYSDEYGEATFNSLGSKDAFTAVYSSSGSFQWARNFGSMTNEQCNAVTIPNDGFVTLAGTKSDSALIVPVTGSAVDGLSDLIDNENSGLNYCGDPFYGNFRSLEAFGGLDGFVLKAIDPDRSPLDFYQRSGGGCDVSIPEGCIYLNSGSDPPVPCPESVTGCAPYALTATNYTLNDIGFGSTYAWTPSASTGLISLVTSEGVQSVTITSADGCYTATDDVLAEVVPGPEAPLITDSEGVNTQNPTPFPILICPGGTVDITADFPPEYTFQWSGGQFGGNPVFTQEISVNEEGSYFITVTSPDGCTISSVVNVIFLNVPEDVPPLISFNTASDTVQVCQGSSFNATLLNELNLDPYPTQQYLIDWTVSPGGAIDGNGSVEIITDVGGWYVVTVELESLETPCIEGIFTQFATDSIFVEIVPVPESFIEISGPEFYCPGDTLVLILDYEGDLEFDFDFIENFGDSIYISGSGFYEIFSSAQNEFGCVATDSDFLSIEEVSTPQISTMPEDAVVCPGDSILISTATPGTITWQGPSGTFDGDTDIYVQESGLYFAEVEFYEGCALVSNTVEVTEFATPFLDGSNAVLCPGGEVDISIVSSALDDIEWQAPLFGSDTVQTVSEPGTYSVLVTGCNVTTELFIEVELTEYDVEIEVVDPGPVCDGDSILISATSGLEGYQWVPSGTGEEQWFTESGSVFVIATDEYGCELLSEPIEIDFETTPPLPPFDFELVCLGEPFSLTVPTSLNVNFLDGPNGSLISNETSVFIDGFLSDTTFYVFLNSQFCEGPLDSISLSPKPYPDAPVPTTDAPVCTGQSLSLEVLNSAAGVDYIWLAPNGDTFEGDLVAYGISDISQEGEYLAYADLDDCLSDTVGIEVSLFLTRQVDLPPDTALCYRTDFFIAPDTVFATYQWQDLSSDSVFYPQLGETAQIVLTVTDFNGCESIDITTVDFADCAVNVPNVITPNGDGLNDGWVLGLDRPQFFEVVIYNRWGRVVYESKNRLQIWDGVHYKTDEPCSEGEYFYILRVNDFEGKAFEQQGSLTLIRN